MESSSKYETRMGVSPEESGGAVERALDILELLEATEEPQTLSQIGGALDLPKASTHRLLATLRTRGYVRQERARGGYVLGVRVLPLAARARERLGLVGIAEPILRTLSLATGESCQLSIRSGRQAVCVARVASPNHPDLSFAGQVGSVFPLHAVALGKALLAFAPPEEQAAYLAGDLTAFTARTRTDAAALAGELDEIRRTGVARDDEEYKRGLSALAVPVFGADGMVSTALALPFLTGASVEGDAVADLREAGASLSLALGHRKR